MLLASMAMIDVAILVAVVGGGAVALRLLWSRGGDPESDEVWKNAARRVGGEVEITTSRFLRPTERRIRLAVDGVAILVRTDRRRSGNSDAYYTHVSSGPLPSAGVTRIHCVRRDLVLKLSKRLGLAPLLTGHPDFDDVVHVSGAPTSVVHAFLDGPTRRLVAESEGGFDLEDGRLFVEREGIPVEADSLVAMARFAERLVQRWCGLVRATARLAESLQLAPDETFAVGERSGLIARGVHRSRVTTLSLRVDGELALTVVAFEDPSVGEWTMERDDNDAFTTSGEPPEPIRTFVSVAPASLLGMRGIAGTIELAFDGFAPDLAEVMASLDASIDATTPLAPYR